MFKKLMADVVAGLHKLHAAKTADAYFDAWRDFNKACAAMFDALHWFVFNHPDQSLKGQQRRRLITRFFRFRQRLGEAVENGCRIRIYSACSR